MGQITLSDVEAKAWLSRMPERDLEILRLLTEGGWPAARIARLKGISKPLISRLIHQAMELHLLSSISTRPYNRKYKAEAPLKTFITATANPPDGVRPYTVCRPHNIRLKYRISLLEGTISRDKRAGYQKSWKPRGPERLLYWIPGRVDMGSVTIEVHPGSLVGYYSSHQEVVAESVAAAEALILTSIHEAILKFVIFQSRFGCRIDLEAPTTRDPTALSALQATATHYAFKASRGGPLGVMVGQRVGEWWVDGSPRDAGDPDHIEVETRSLPEATALDAGIKAIQAAGTQGPDLLKEMERRLSPLEALTSKVEAIHAMVSSGTTLQARYDQMVGILAATLSRLERLERRVNGEDPPGSL